MIFASLAAGFFVAEYFTNPDLPNPLRKIPTLKWQSGEERFKLPKVVSTSTENTVRVLCNLSSYDFVVGNPSLISIEVGIPKDYDYIILGVDALPFDATEYVPSWMNMTAEMLSEISLMMVYNGTWSETYACKTSIVFQSSGSLRLGIVVHMCPSKFTWWSVNWSTFNSAPTETLQFQSIIIESGQTIQQQASENRNLSLAYFVLFFASTDIAIALYDHSEDKDKAFRYQEEKERKKHDDITKYGKYAV
jgi:hypothetical protein